MSPLNNTFHKKCSYKKDQNDPTCSWARWPVTRFSGYWSRELQKTATFSSANLRNSLCSEQVKLVVVVVITKFSSG